MGIRSLIGRAASRVARWGSNGTVTKADYDPEWSVNRLPINTDQKLDKPYAQHDIVYGCINSWATRVSAVPWVFYEGPTDNARLIESGPLYDVFNRPNNSWSGSTLWEATVTYLGLDGNAVWLLERNAPTQPPKELWVFPRNRFDPHFYPGTWNISYWTFWNRDRTRSKRLEWFQALPVRLFSPYSEFWGVGPWEAAKKNAEQDWWASLYNEQFFKNSGDPGGIVKVERTLQKDQKDALLAQWESRHVGWGKSHRVALLDGKASYEQLKVSHKSMDWLPQRQFHAERIAGTYRVPLIELNQGYDRVHKAVQENTLRAYYTGTLDPIMRNLEAAFRSQFFMPYDNENTWGMFDRTAVPYFQEDFNERLEAAQKLFGLGVPVAQLNTQFDLGLEPFDGWDLSYLPIGLLPSGARGMLTPTPQQESIEVTATRSVPLAIAEAKAPSHTELQAAIWRDWYAVIGPTERGFEQSLRSYLLKIWHEVESNLKNLGVPSQTVADLLDEFKPEDFFFPVTRNADLQALSARYYRRVMKAAGPVIDNHIANAGIGFEFNPDSTAIRALIAKKELKVVGVNDTIKNDIRAILLRGAEKGDTVGEVATSLKDSIKSTARSQAIARTEMASAATQAEYISYEAAGVKKHMWIAAMDEVTRDTHMHNMSLGARPIGSMYPNQCKYALDENGPPGEVINCRCNMMAVE